MTPQSPAVLERLLRNNDLGWLIDYHSSPDQVIPKLLEHLDKVATSYRTRIGVAVPFNFSPEALEAEAVRNPHKVRAFLQALATSASEKMLVMVWRILQGLSIRGVTMNYKEREPFSLVVTLSRPEDDQDVLEEYRSEDIDDAVLVRHFGITTISGRRVFDGFFPLRVKESTWLP